MLQSDFSFSVPINLTKGEEDKFIPEDYILTFINSGEEDVLRTMPKMCQLCMVDLAVKLLESPKLYIQLACLCPGTDEANNTDIIVRNYRDSENGTKLNTICNSFCNQIAEV